MRDDVLRSFTGLMGWNDTMAPAWYAWTFYAALMIGLLLESRGADVIAWRTRAVLLLAAVASIDTPDRM